MYGADELPSMSAQSVFSITMRNTVRMAPPAAGEPPPGNVVVVVLGAKASPRQAATPSRLQRPSTRRLQARGRPPAPTHEAICSRHAFRHCLERDTASRGVATSSATSRVSSDTNPKAFGR